MDHRQEKLLLGALIGIARAASGSEHLITPEITALMRQSLISLGNRDTEEQLAKLTGQAAQAKYGMVPNCYTCAAPCGRTLDYDMDQLQQAEPQDRAIKQALLERIQHLAVLPSARWEQDGCRIRNFIFQVLFLVGEDYLTVRELTPILEQAEEMLAREF